MPPAPAPPVSEVPAVVPPAPEPPTPAPPAPLTPFLDEASFAARLEEASFETEARLAELAPEPEPEPEPAPPAPRGPVVHRL